MIKRGIEIIVSAVVTVILCFLLQLLYVANVAKIGMVKMENNVLTATVLAAREVSCPNFDAKIAVIPATGAHTWIIQDTNGVFSGWNSNMTRNTARGMSSSRRKHTK